jgi:hypothetical protein
MSFLCPKIKRELMRHKNVLGLLPMATFLWTDVDDASLAAELF